MKLFIDIISGDELGSDAYDHKLVDDIVYELDAAQIVVTDGDVDIGGNPSAEEQAEALENGGQTVINIVHSFRLQQTSFDKKQYLSHLKGYMKSIKEKLAASNPERVPIFEKKAAEYAKKIIANFKDYDFYVGESLDENGMVALLNYRPENDTPYITLWSDGLRLTKI